jgi:soluble lytic murein transglycosylase-like protein
MNYRNLTYTTFVFAIIVFMILKTGNTVKTSGRVADSVTTLVIYRADVNTSAPPCLQMYYAIEKYAAQYNIPRNYAYGIAFKETRYEGPFHWKYKHTQESCAGALGPMQIMFATGKSNWDQPVTAKRLMNDIDLNVHISMKVLRKMFNKYKDWKIVFGCYNTGRPMVNGYAEDVYNHKIKFRKYE